MSSTNDELMTSERHMGALQDRLKKDKRRADKLAKDIERVKKRLSRGTLLAISGLLSSAGFHFGNVGS